MTDDGATSPRPAMRPVAAGRREARERALHLLYEAAMKEIGFSHGGKDDKPETFFDGKAFDPANPEAYAASFDVKNLKG